DSSAQKRSQQTTPSRRGGIRPVASHGQRRSDSDCLDRTHLACESDSVLFRPCRWWAANLHSSRKESERVFQGLSRILGFFSHVREHLDLRRRLDFGHSKSGNQEVVIADPFTIF